MTRNAKLGLVLAAGLLSAAPLSLHSSPGAILSVSLDRAEARVGRPLTPMSVAGVNRRVHRRAYYGAAAGAAAVGAAAYGAYRHRRTCGYAPYSHPAIEARRWLHSGARGTLGEGGEAHGGQASGRLRRPLPRSLRAQTDPVGGASGTFYPPFQFLKCRRARPTGGETS